MRNVIFVWRERNGEGIYRPDNFNAAGVKYIRSDLVEKLKGYAVHDRDCSGGPAPCTCGLTEVLKEMGR